MLADEGEALHRLLLVADNEEALLAFRPGGVKTASDVDSLGGHFGFEVADFDDLLDGLGLGHIHLLDAIPDRKIDRLIYR